ncbi:MAG: response regulator transcription factor [Thiofilum sp.]|uniref:response regulator transcription factor n=1 Tax=Thiofilum sp. TaxID=2212733 RepID=UPI0025DA898B|nr:response regulator transcription factor [Thiofilum sp.]MBK8453450.1 response regulator transcription factor [Thiofilum sp.]
MRLLIVEDDQELTTLLQQRFKAAGFAVDLAHNGMDGQFMGEEIDYDAIILDLGLPQKNGIEVLKAWRAKPILTPVIVLTARDAWHERVDGFKAGADDYLGKPFHFEELLVRIQALIRRAHQAVTPNNILDCCGLKLDEDHQTVTTADGMTHELTGKEFRLLRYFMLHPNQILTKSRLTDHVYEYDTDRDSNVIEVYVRHLRRMIGTDRIVTKRGQGYSLIT